MLDSNSVIVSGTFVTPGFVEERTTGSDIVLVRFSLG